MSKDKYISVRQTAARNGSANKCVPIALTLLLDMEYTVVLRSLNKATKVFKGRRPTKRSGYNMSVYIPMAQGWADQRGYDLVEIPREEWRRVAKTGRTMTAKARARLGLENGLIRTTGHLGAVVDSQWLDHAAGRTSRIRNIWKLVKQEVEQ